MDGAEKSTCQKGSKNLCTTWRKHQNHLRAPLGFFQLLNFAFACFLLQNFRQNGCFCSLRRNLCLEQHFSGFFCPGTAKARKNSVLFRAIPWGGQWGGVQGPQKNTRISVLFHAIPCYSVLFREIPCNAVQFRAIPCDSVEEEF